MVIELGSAAVGGVIGLLGGISGVALTHALASRRESRTRKIEGLREVVRELEKRRRLALDMAQHINLALRDRPAERVAAEIFQSAGWKEATLALHERTWLFSCLAYLPEGLAEFQELDGQIGVLMDPESSDSASGNRGQDIAAGRINELSRLIRERVAVKLRSLV